MAKSSGSAFDFKLFMRLLSFTRPYRGTFIFVAFAAVGLSVAGLLGPIFLKNTIDLGMIPKDYSTMLFYIGLIVVAVGPGGSFFNLVLSITQTGSGRR